MIGRRRGRLIVTAAIAALVTFACAKREEAPGPPRLVWEMRDLQRSWSADSADTSSEVWVSLHYPEFLSVAGEPAALDSLNDWVERTLVAASLTDSAPGDLDALAGQMVANYQEVRRRFGAAPAPWFYENEIRVTWDTLDVVSMISTADSYTGGAHGAAVKIWGVLDANHGNRLTIGDLIAASARDTLLKLGEQAFREARGIPLDVPLARSGFWFDAGRFRLTSNFGLDRDGLVFYYNAYEVGPYSMGPTTITISWNSIAGYIRPDGPLRSLRPI